MISLLINQSQSATLVICPVVAMLQWKQEIQKYTEENALKIAVFHGKLI
jgi:DNA repair protein RAD16